MCDPSRSGYWLTRRYPSLPDDLLAIYLTDHLAGATAGSARMRRLADHESSASDGAALATIAFDIEQDQQTLKTILVAIDVSPRWYTSAGAWLVERVGLLKTNGRLIRRSPLTSVIELEFMRMGVTGKIALWQSLKHTDLRHQFDFDELLERAIRQLHGLEAAHDLRAPVIGQRTTDQ
jgi:hypothetical protein